MTNEQARSLAERNEDLTRDMLRHAHLVTSDPTEQALALLTAATVLIERDVGRAMAPVTLWALVEPTLADWMAPLPGEVIQ